MNFERARTGVVRALFVLRFACNESRRAAVFLRGRCPEMRRLFEPMRQPPWRVMVAAALAAGTGMACGASVQQADVTSTLGPSFLLDAAATGGSDYTVNEPATGNFNRDLGVLNVGAGGSRVTITGIGWGTSSSATANDADTATVTVTYLGADGVFGGGDDVVMGTESASWAHVGAGEYAWALDTPMEAVVDGAGSMFRIAIQPGNAGGTGSLRFKTTGGGGGAKISVGVPGEVSSAVVKAASPARTTVPSARYVNSRKSARLSWGGPANSRNSRTSVPMFS